MRPQVTGILFIISLAVIAVTPTATVAAAPNTIRVYFNKSIGTVNKKVFGNSLFGNEPVGSTNVSASNFGYGIWDPQLKAPVQSVVDLAKAVKITSFRFPGAFRAHSYNWKNAISSGRTTFLFGVDEYLKTCGVIGALPVFTLNCITMSEKDAADLVEYLNAPNDGAHPWAAKRANKGHPTPYRVKYFEVGNETWFLMSAEAYAQLFLKYYNAIKAVDPSAQVGVVLSSDAWNKTVMDIIKEKVDFGIFHMYPTPGWDNEVETLPADKIFNISLEQPQYNFQALFSRNQTYYRRLTGRTLPFAISEFNGGYQKDVPLPYRFTLGCALVNAEVIRVLLHPSNHVLFANHWSFVNDSWGMISNDSHIRQDTLGRPYYKRPNYHVFDLYSNHFGDVILNAELQGARRQLPPDEFIMVKAAWRISSSNLLSGNWQVTPVSGVATAQASGVLTINFTNTSTFSYYHTQQTAAVEPNTYYRISGFLRAENLVDINGIGIEVIDSRGATAARPNLITTKVIGTTGWVYVENRYKTAPDASSVTVRARRVGKTGPLSGKVYFKDIKLEKLTPITEDVKFHYLTAITSKSSDGNKLYLMVINKDQVSSQTAEITLDGFTAKALGHAYVLNGPDMLAMNESDHDNVKVTHRTFDVPLSGIFDYTFEPHSVTAIELDRY